VITREKKHRFDNLEALEKIEYEEVRLLYIAICYLASPISGTTIIDAGKRSRKIAFGK
jgi:hypothetical protein